AIAIDKLLIRLIKYELSFPVKKWKKYIIPIYLLRLQLLNFRREKWIINIVRESLLLWKFDSYFIKNIGYCFMNLTNRYCYFGETTSDALTRLYGHNKDRTIKDYRKTYKHINNL